MSQLSSSSFDVALLVRNTEGSYALASMGQILEAASLAINQKTQRSGSSYTNDGQGYLRAKLSG